MQLPFPTISHEFFLTKIRNSEPFSFVRYGDGEWLCIRYGPSRSIFKKKNCDGTVYTKALAQDLKNSIINHHKDPNYHYSTHNGWFKSKKYTEFFLNFHKENNIESLPWISGDIGHTLSSEKKISKLVEAMNSCKFSKCFIGPRRLLKSLKINHVKFDHFIEVPLLDSYSIKHELIKRIDELGENHLFFFSAGMVTKIVIWDCWKRIKNAIFLDLGAIWEPYMGLAIRDYHKELLLQSGKRL